MMEQVSLSKKPSHKLIQDVALETGIDPAFIEKDWYAVQLVSLIAAQNRQQSFQAIFSGGTSLSKGYELIKRFSEDLDFIVSIPDNTKISGGQRRKFRHHTVSQLNEHPNYFEIEPSTIKRGDNHRFFKVSTIYPKAFKNSALRSSLQLEMTFFEPRIKPIHSPIQLIINKVLDEKPETTISCVSPLETAGDKISALS